jgi:hypothetical protein
MAPPPPSSSSRHQPYEYLDALLAAIPNDSIVPPEITASPSRSGANRPYPKFIDTALRLASGGPARPDDATNVRDAWPEIQTTVLRALHALHPSTTTQQQPTKRKHSPPSSSSLPGGANNNKKPKYEDGPNDDDDDDIPQLTLHALSATAPVRHKIDITLHVHTLRLAHSTTGAHVTRCALTALTRVFLLPTRARSSGALQWTALLLGGDKPAPPPPRGAKAKGAANAAAAAVRFELACSVPDSFSPAAIPRLTVHTPTPTSDSHITSTREALLALLSPTISGTPIALTTVERGAPLAGITAFLSVRETALWFLDEGILANGRPAEYWALADLAPGEAGVRVRTATGRTCSVALMRRGGGGGTGERDGEEEEEEEGEETEFQMIDGKEREVILEWVRKHRGAFGTAANARGEEDDNDDADAQAAPRGAAAAKADSDSDSDFETESGDSDGGSPSSSSGSGSGSGPGPRPGPRPGPGSDAGSDAAGSSEHDEEDEPRSRSGSESGGDDDQAMMDLDPKHHPLLRAGGLPKMSLAAMEAAVELVVGDLVGKKVPDGDAPGPAPAPGLGRPTDVEGDDDEEDELED